jgi:hypothetical protein
MHSLLIKGIPESIPYELAQKEISDMLYESYSSEILQVRVVGRQGGLIKLAKAWKRTRDRLDLAIREPAPPLD